MSRFVSIAIVAAMALWIIDTGGIGAGTAWADFFAEWDSNKRLGRLVPSLHHGGVVFEDCAGNRWTIAGAKFEWTDETCPAQTGTRGSTLALDGVSPKPRACSLCMENPDLVDLRRKAPGALDTFLKNYQCHPDFLGLFEQQGPRMSDRLDPETLQSLPQPGSLLGPGSAVK